MERTDEIVSRWKFCYAELDVATNFSFLRGASHPDEYVNRAAEMGYRAIAVTDVNSLAGIVRAHEAAKFVGLKLLIGARLTFTDAPDLLVWATDRAAYGRLCRLLTLGKRRAKKGNCTLHLDDFLDHQEGLLAAVVLPAIPTTSPLIPTPPLVIPSAARNLQSRDTLAPEIPRCARDDRGVRDDTRAARDDTHALSVLHEAMGNRLSLAVSCLYSDDDTRRVERIAELGRQFHIPLLATNHVHYHDPSRRALQDVLTCIRHQCNIHEAGYRLFPNGERYLKSPAQMHRLFSDHPHAITRGIEIAEQCTFSLDELKYEYPDEIVPEGQTPIEYLAQLTWAGARQRYPEGIPDKVRALLQRELALIEKLKFEAYFLTVYDIVHFARSREILCQGRGSAANSAVCYCLGVTSVDPARVDVLFERFVSAARNEPPDIDVDFEHERREEVIQYIYEKYTRQRAGMTATVITYRGRSAVRDVGKALGLGLDAVDQLARRLDWWDRGTLSANQLRESGVDPTDSTVQQLVALTSQLLGFPRHLSQHTGGMVMTRGPLCELVPIENASMEDRTVIEWDKDDIDALGILKVDVLALGMLTAIAKGLKLIAESDGATKRRSDEGGGERQSDGLWVNKSSATQCERSICDGRRNKDEGQDVSRSDCVAAGNGTGTSDLSEHGNNAGRGALWTDRADAQGGGLHSLQHRRRTRPAEPPGLLEAPENLPRIAGGTANADGAGLEPESPGGELNPRLAASGNGSHTPRPHREPGTEAIASSPSLRRSVASSLRRSPLQLHTIPPEDPAVYEMICDADTIGVFQIESRAQMSMLPRLRPEKFYDLVIEVAIVRPGPIQGNMVHPYLERREMVRQGRGHEITYESDELRDVLSHTLGVPLFQEQAMRVVMVAAGFSAEEADQLRRAMAAWRKSGAIEKFHDKIIRGMLANGYTREFAERVFEQIRGFGEYGFPESHAASFALLVYASAWIKRHYPAEFCAALLNSQPMGFYAPAQIIRDAIEHGVEIRPVDVNASEWDCTLEPREISNLKSQISNSKSHNSDSCSFVSIRGSASRSAWGLSGPAVRLGFRRVKGLHASYTDVLVATRERIGRFTSIAQLHRATELPVSALRRLAEADAFGSLNLTRREALWQVLELSDEELPLYTQVEEESAEHPSLPQMPLGQEVMTDYSTTGHSLKEHPVALVRDELSRRGIIPTRRIYQLSSGWVSVAGLVLIRQRPGTANGIVFMTLEDETGIVNLIVKPDVYERFRPAARHAMLLHAQGRLQRHGQVVHIIPSRMFDLSDLLAGYELVSRDFH